MGCGGSKGSSVDVQDSHRKIDPVTDKPQHCNDEYSGEGTKTAVKPKSEGPDAVQNSSSSLKRPGSGNSSKDAPMERKDGEGASGCAQEAIAEASSTEAASVIKEAERRASGEVQKDGKDVSPNGTAPVERQDAVHAAEVTLKETTQTPAEREDSGIVQSDSPSVRAEDDTQKKAESESLQPSATSENGPMQGGQESKPGEKNQTENEPSQSNAQDVAAAGPKEEEAPIAGTETEPQAAANAEEDGALQKSGEAGDAPQNSATEERKNSSTDDKEESRCPPSDKKEDVPPPSGLDSIKEEAERKSEAKEDGFEFKTEGGEAVKIMDE